MPRSHASGSLRFSAERQAKILESLRARGRVEVLELARILRVSEHTVRRDLLMLQSQGVLQRTHGGAVSIDTARLDLAGRAVVMPKTKAAIGRAAAALFEPGQTVIIDAGSTGLALARALAVRPLTVITNSLDIAQVFTQDAQVQLTLTGGSWQPGARALWGPAADEMLKHCRADWAVPGACALDTATGVTVSDEADAALKRTMISRARKTMVLGDTSKRDGVAPFLVAEWSQVHALVTDLAWPELEALGVSVVLAQD
jgi:DeoR/GlpR family transcriptional regulator of sugar metabolism